MITELIDATFGRWFGWLGSEYMFQPAISIANAASFYADAHFRGWLVVGLHIRSCFPSVLLLLRLMRIAGGGEVRMIYTSNLGMPSLVTGR